jgi:toxin ParE1/3/4
MSKRFSLTRAARTDLITIWNYLAETASFDVADKVAADLQAGIQKIAETPKIGHTRADLTARPILFFLVHRYLILYSDEEKPLRVLRIFHASRDIATLLDGR